MGTFNSACFAVFLSLAASNSVLARENGPATKAPTHPQDVAFIDEGEKGHVYRKFPSGERLYTNDRDRSGASLCNIGCSSAWPPVYAPPDALPIGEWSIVQRSDGKKQWALKGKPVYTRFHDTPEVASGDGLSGVWHVIPYTRKSGNPSVDALLVSSYGDAQAANTRGISGSSAVATFQEEEDGHGFATGLLGLIGLVGLFGRRLKDHVLRGSMHKF